MRIAIIDDSLARAAVIEEGLRETGLSDVTVFTERQGLVARLEALAPDVILIDLANPRRDELEEAFAVSRAISRPVAMFVDQSDAAAMEAAIDAGVSAYVVDGMTKARIKPVLELAIRRFNAFARLRSELDEARSALAGGAAAIGRYCRALAYPVAPQLSGGQQRHPASAGRQPRLSTRATGSGRSAGAALRQCRAALCRDGGRLDSGTHARRSLVRQ